MTPLPTEEVKRQVTLSQNAMKPNDLLLKFSSFDKLIRVMTYVLRFVSGTRNNVSKKCKSPNATDYKKATNKIIQLVQREVYANELEILQKTKSVSNTSELKALNPFIDGDGLMRVGGRLQNASTMQERNPIIMPKHFVTTILIHETHTKYFHCGVNSTLNAVRYKYWPIHGKTQVKKVLRNCVRCARAKPRETNYLMGNLPAPRVQPSPPFTNTEVDFCGPFLLKEKKFRNRNTIKVYVAVFVCFSTKAVHLEAVDSLTSEAFIVTLERFFARRGVASNIYRDNGTNFVGANREIQELIKFVKSEKFNNFVKDHLAFHNIIWHFNSAKSPHMGGLWEAMVKLFKRFLYRAINPSLLTLQEFETLIIKIEAILNSRPIYDPSSDPNDLEPLTPGHFLIGRPLTSPPDPDLSQIQVNRLSNWQHVQFLKQQFWKQWQNEYLHEMNIRSKWKKMTADQIKLGAIVILREDNLPPLCWVLGRIVEVHPGNDGIVRVVSVRTKSGIFKRNLKSVSLLPVKIEEM